MGIAFGSEQNLGSVGLSSIFRYDASAATYSDNLAGDTIYDYFDNDATVGDILYIGLGQSFYYFYDRITFYTGTAMAGTGIIIIPEYWNGSAWINIVNFKDETQGLTQAGEQAFYFDPTKQVGWKTVVVNGVTRSWIRFRMSALTTITEGGAQSSQQTKFTADIVEVTGFSAITSGKYNDIYVADKATIFNLWTGTPAPSITATYNIRPAEGLALKINLILAGTSAGAGDTIDIIGTDKDGNAQNETIDVSSGNGTYTTLKWYASINDSGILCTGFNDGTLTVQQPRRGVIYNSNGQFIVDRQIWLNSCYFSDSCLQATHNLNIWAVGANSYVFIITGTAVVNFGIVSDVANKSTTDGIAFLVKPGATFYSFLNASSSVELNFYSCYFSATSTVAGLIDFNAASGSSRFWNCTVSDGIAIARGKNTDIFQLTAVNTDSILRRTDATTTTDRIYGTGVTNGVYFQSNAGGLVSGIYGRNLTNDVRMENQIGNPCAIVDGDFGRDWIITWSGSNDANGFLRRQYTFDLAISDVSGNKIQGAVVRLTKTGETPISVSTDANGQIIQQVLELGIFDVANGSNIQNDTNWTMNVIKAGYEKYVKEFLPEEQINWNIALQNIAPVFDKFSG